MRPEAKHIVIIQGHPDPAGQHFGHALADAYAMGAHEAGHDVNVVDVAKLDFPLLRSKEDFERGVPPEAIRQIQSALVRCAHVVMFYPVWNGAMPALLKGFLEQTFRPGFTFPDARPGEQLGFFTALRQRKALKGKSGRIVATMQMPAFVYRWCFPPHSEKNTLRLSGVGPIRESLIGFVEAPNGRKRARWLRKMRALGHEAQ